MRYLWILVLAIGCGKDKGKGEDKKSEPPKTVEPSTPEPPPKKKAETTAAALGKTPGPFGKVAKLKMGMPEAEAKAAATELVDEENALKFTLGFDRGRLTKIEVNSTSYARMQELGAEAWGPGKKNKGTMGEVTAWFDPANHTRVIADSSDLDIEEYVPLEELLGEGVEIAAWPKKILGTSRDELKTNYPANVNDKVDHLFFPPAEWGRADMDTHIFMLFTKEKVRSYQFDVRDNGGAEYKEAALAAFKKKWGEPRMKKPYGSDTENMIFHKSKPLIEVDRDVDDKAWNVMIREKDDGCGGPCYKGL